MPANGSATARSNPRVPLHQLFLHRPLFLHPLLLHQPLLHPLSAHPPSLHPLLPLLLHPLFLHPLFRSPAAHTAANTTGCDVAVLGGTGFIGAHVVRRFVARGARVSVMARSIRNLPDVFHDPAVSLHAGDVRDGDAVAAAIGGAPVVINLAHGGAGGSWDDIRTALVGSAETVARACLARGVRRLVHVGSIASLYLGSQDAPVTGATPPDPQADQRADYARAKAMADQLLLAMHASDGLPVCILRPGVVVGEGGPPLHSGLGFFNNEQHCIGWNAGRNPLPFVLVDDVARGDLRPAEADGIDGRCYNLVGDVRWSARDYFAALGRRWSGRCGSIRNRRPCCGCGNAANGWSSVRPAATFRCRAGAICCRAA